MFAFLAGLAAGLLHVFSGPDHLAAVAPLAADSDRADWKTGLQWGIGHTFGVLLIALLLLLIRDQLPLDIISANSERLVGVALICVGAWGVWKASRSGLTPHRHSHAGASFGMGALHGLAGSSHLFGVLPALAFATRLEAGLYLAGFGAGAIVGMSAFSAVMGLLSSRLSPRHSSGLLYASSAAALVIGGVWLVGQ
jgi:uncharacterized membrane protein YfcA